MSKSHHAHIFIWHGLTRQPASEGSRRAVVVGHGGRAVGGDVDARSLRVADCIPLVDAAARLAQVDSVRLVVDGVVAHRRLAARLGLDTVLLVGVYAVAVEQTASALIGNETGAAVVVDPVAHELRVGRPLHARPVLSREHARLLLVVDPVPPKDGRRARLDLHTATPVGGDVVPLVGASAAVVDDNPGRPVPAQSVAHHGRVRALLDLEAAPGVVDYVVILEGAEAVLVHPHAEGPLGEDAVVRKLRTGPRPHLHAALTVGGDVVVQGDAAAVVKGDEPGALVVMNEVAQQRRVGPVRDLHARPAIAPYFVALDQTARGRAKPDAGRRARVNARVPDDGSGGVGHLNAQTRGGRDVAAGHLQRPVRAQEARASRPARLAKQDVVQPRKERRRVHSVVARRGDCDARPAAGRGAADDGDGHVEHQALPVDTRPDQDALARLDGAEGGRDCCVVAAEA
eukprot:scaffold12829_cov116-Isochrysis_galbana.AAC.18